MAVSYTHLDVYKRQIITFAFFDGGTFISALLFLIALIDCIISSILSTSCLLYTSHGWVGSSGRGRVAGVGIKNMKSDYEYVVGFSNDEAQYWTKASDSNEMCIRDSHHISALLPARRVQCILDC